MDEEYRFTDKQYQHIHWNTLIPHMLDIWFAVRATKDIDTGEVVIKVSEEHKAQAADPMRYPDVLKLVEQLAALQVRFDKLAIERDSILSSVKLARIYLTQGNGLALNIVKAILGEDIQ